MPDISMCIPHNCPVKDKCYRFTAKPTDGWQAYQERVAGDDGCPSYWPVRQIQNLRERVNNGTHD